ncbi:c-type cytochrome [Tropicibacter sp. S64]|uniref:c-type cytochrome n=1 Tax=Tropicibacter sp. S64 TaxID=3415122 RepID=UPI003C7CB98A
MKTLIGILALTLTPTLALAESHGGTGDPDAGEKVFRKCKACHAIGEGAENKVGPELNGIVGRQVGHEPDFSYSDAMKAKGADGTVWDAESLMAFLEKPKDYVPGTKMAFAGLRKEEERADVVAYLATFPAPAE